MADLAPAVSATLERCLRVRAGEQFVIVVDPGTREIGEAFAAGARELGVEPTLVVMDERATHGSEPPRPVAAALAACDAFVAPTTKSLSHTAARRHASEAGARGATLPGVTAEMLERTMSGDPAALVARSRAVAALLHAGAQAHVTCPLGTDLVLELSGRAGLADDGDYGERGAFGNLPAGEGFIAPLDGAGTVVASSLAGIGISETPARLEVRGGHLVAAEHGGGPELLEMLRAHGELGTNLAELGVGTNAEATLTGQVLEDEKILGSVHVAFGASAAIGGTVAVPVHLDVVVVDATLEIDGRPVLDAGRFVLDV